MTRNILVFIFIYAVLDLALTCVLLARLSKWNDFLISLRERYFGSTSFDILLFSILRTGGLLGAVIGLLKNSSQGPERVKASLYVILSVATSCLIYLCIKLLVHSESAAFIEDDHHNMWFWIIFSWSFLSFIITTALWMMLANFRQNTCTVSVDANSINVVDEETNPLPRNLHSYGSTENGKYSDSEEDEDDFDMSSSDSNSNGDTGEGKPKKKKRISKATILKMLSYSKPDILLILGAIVFLIGAAVAEIFIPLFTGRVISGIAIERDSGKFTKNIIIMAFISIAASLCAGCRGGMMSVVIARFDIRIRNKLFDSLTSQEIGFFDMNKTGDMLSRLTQDTSTMSSTIGLNFNIFLRSIIKGIGTCIFMFSLSWRLTIITFMGLPLIVAVSKIYGNFYKKLQTQVQDAYAKANEVAEEVCSSMKTVRSFANEGGEKTRYSLRLNSVYRIKLKQCMAYAGYMWSNELFELLLGVVILWYGGHLLSLSIVTPENLIAFLFYQADLGECFEEIGEISELALITGTLWYGGHLVMESLMDSQNLIAFILYQITLGDCLQSIGTVYTGLMQALGAAEKVFRLIDRKPRIQLDKNNYTPSTIEGRVTFQNVSFAYPSRPDQLVLKNVSFEALPGQVTALVGPSGGGKSSCVNLLEHFYETCSGSVLVDGKQVEQYCHKYLHKKITLVGQEPVLYARSIKENIAYGMEEHEYTSSDITEASIKANAHEFITELKDQYDTETGEKGMQLSGGQKQRVAIARALIRNPKILILDEATSALDTESEYMVQQALERTMKHRTVIVIAHRLSTVERADKIIVINNGVVMEQGNHVELMEARGMYYKLVHRQLHKKGTHNGNTSRKKRKGPREIDSGKIEPGMEFFPLSRSYPVYNYHLSVIGEKNHSDSDSEDSPAFLKL